MSPAKDPAAQIQQLREGIDRIDRELLGLLNERLQLAKSIGALKNTDGSPIFVASREKEILERILGRNLGPFPNESLLRIYREIFSTSRQAERPLRASYVGHPKSLGHAAARSMFGGSIQLDAHPSSRQALKDVAQKKSDYAVLPAVLASEGLEELALVQIFESRLYLVAEFHLPLALSIAMPPQRKAFSKLLVPLAFVNVASERLFRSLPGTTVEWVAHSDLALERLEAEEDSAAVLPRFATEGSDLREEKVLLAEREGSFVRYFVAARELAAPTGNDKTTLAFRLINEAGNLSRALRPFEERRINLDLVTTARSPRHPRADLFFLDCEGHSTETDLAQTLSELAKVCNQVEILGSYPVFDLHARRPWPFSQRPGVEASP